MRLLLGLLIVVLGCGEDSAKNKPTPATTAPPAKPATAATSPGAGSGSGKPLPSLLHAEDRVNCPIPRSGSHKCDPNVTKPVTLGDTPVQRKAEDLWCEDGEVCQNTTEGYLCGPCPERFAIRHEFKDRDFAPETNRDPFQPSVGKLPGGSGSNGEVTDPTSRCVRAEQLRVTNYGYLDLKLVGIVSQGTQRKVLMMDPGNYGHIIKRGDCVGKEKAWVKDIGENFICFELTSDQAAAARMPEGQCIELHTKQLAVSSLPTDSLDTTQPITPPSAPGPTITPRTGANAPEPPPPPQPQQPPTDIKP